MINRIDPVLFFVALILVSGCATVKKDKRTPPPEFIHYEDVIGCVSDQALLYGDICAEETSGYEDKTGTEAHYLGVRCAVETIAMCLDVDEKMKAIHGELPLE